MTNEEREITLGEFELNGVVQDLKISVWKIARVLKHSQMAELLDDWCNSGMKDYRDGEVVGKALQNSHRTIQASVMRFCLGVIIALSRQEYTDARNEMPVQMGKQIAAMIEDGTLKMGWMI